MSTPPGTTAQIAGVGPAHSVQSVGRICLMRGASPACERIVATGVPDRSPAISASSCGVSTQLFSYVVLRARNPS